MRLDVGQLLWAGFAGTELSNAEQARFGGGRVGGAILFARNLESGPDGTDIGAFLTPGLRELKQTAPYMHNGTFKSLKEVVAFYNKGGGRDPNRDPRIKPLDLSKAEQADLVAFLEALSGQPLTGAEFVWAGEIPDDYPAIENWRKTRN